MLVRAASSILSWGWGRVSHVLWSVGLSSYSRGLRGCWGHLLSPSGVLAACNRRSRRRRNAACRHLQSVQRPPRGRATGLSTENSTAGGRFGLPWFHEFFVRLALFFIQRQVFNCWGRGIKLPLILVIRKPRLNIRTIIKYYRFMWNHLQIRFFILSVSTLYIFICICGKSLFDT